MLSSRGELSWLQTPDLDAEGLRVATAIDGTIWGAGWTVDAKSAFRQFRQIGNSAEESGTGFLIVTSQDGKAVLLSLADGDIVVGGVASGQIDVGDGARRCGSEGVLIARLHPDGSHVWSTCAATPDDFAAGPDGQPQLNALASVRDDVVVCGRYSGSLTLGSSNIKPGESGPGGDSSPDLFIGAVSAATGEPRWLRGHGGPAQQCCNALAATQDSVLVGAHGGDELLDRPHDGYDYTEPTVVSYHPDGSRAWGWVDERHMGGAQAVFALADGRVLALTDEDRGASLVLLDAGRVLARAALHGDGGPLHEKRIDAFDAAWLGDGSIVVVGIAFPSDETGVRSDHAFVAKLIVNP